MALTNAQRQKRYRQRLQARAKAASTATDFAAAFNKVAEDELRKWLEESDDDVVDHIERLLAEVVSGTPLFSERDVELIVFDALEGKSQTKRKEWERAEKRAARKTQIKP